MMTNVHQFRERVGAAKSVTMTGARDTVLLIASRRSVVSGKGRKVAELCLAPKTANTGCFTAA